MKREKKTLALLLAVLLMMSVLAGCGNTAPAAPAATEAPAPVEEAPAEEAPADAAPAASETDTRTVTDVLGREVEIPAELKAVACPGLPSTRMVVYAGALDRIAGVTQNEKMELVCAPCSDVNHDVLFPLPVIGSGWPNSEIYQEELVVLDPDAIILFTSDPAQADELQEQTGIPVLAVFATDYMTEDFAATMNFLGDVFGTKDHTDALLAYVQACIEDLDSRTKNIPDEEKPTVYYGAVSFRGYNGIDATYAHYNPFDMIHARNVADETGGNGAMTVEKEQVATWDPDILFINQEGPTLGILKSDFETNPDFYRELSAVQNGQVYGQLAYNCVYTNIELSLVNTYFAATVIYPEQFADVDFDAKADEILTMFLGENGPSFMDMMDEAGLSYQHFAMFD